MAEGGGGGLDKGASLSRGPVHVLSAHECSCKRVALLWGFRAMKLRHVFVSWTVAVLSAVQSVAGCRRRRGL